MLYLPEIKVELMQIFLASTYKDCTEFLLKVDEMFNIIEPNSVLMTFDPFQGYIRIKLDETRINSV